jgi:predicted MFS family arabinose efflux permease
VSGSFRAAVFGANDGLVSNLALVLGIAGAGESARTVLLTGIAGLLLVAAGLHAGTGGDPVVLAGAAAFGLTYGAVQNLTLVIALARAGERGTETVSAVWNACYDSGTAIGALAVGAVATQLGLPLTYAVVAGLLALVLPMALTLPRALRSAR